MSFKGTHRPSRLHLDDTHPAIDILCIDSFMYVAAGDVIPVNLFSHHQTKHSPK